MLFKDAMNVLLVANNTTNEVNFTGDEVVHGERRNVTRFFPAKTNDRIWVGWFSYIKSTFLVGPFGFHGSQFGAGFSTSTGDLSVGMDCPNSLFGGRNSIRLVKGLDPSEATHLADTSRNSDDELIFADGAMTSVRRANQWGNINYGYCIFD
jgi:hypothetical protein